MTDQNINIIPAGDTLEIRTGTAPDIHIPKDIKLAGVVTSPLDYSQKRKPDPAHCHVLLDREMGKVTLIANAGLRPQTTVVGLMEADPHFAMFRINTEHTWSQPSELAKIIKRKKRFFSVPGDADKLVSSLKGYRAKIETELEKVKDSRGNSRDVVIKKVTSDIETSFLMNMPIFKRRDSVRFKVDICIDHRENGLDIWLESDELEGIISDQTNSIFNMLEDEFSEAGYVIINQ